jgi:hypothetical protein
VRGCWCGVWRSWWVARDSSRSGRWLAADNEGTVADVVKEVAEVDEAGDADEVDVAVDVDGTGETEEAADTVGERGETDEVAPVAVKKAC